MKAHLFIGMIILVCVVSLGDEYNHMRNNCRILFRTAEGFALINFNSVKQSTRCVCAGQRRGILARIYFVVCIVNTVSKRRLFKARSVRAESLNLKCKAAVPATIGNWQVVLAPSVTPVKSARR